MVLGIFPFDPLSGENKYYIFAKGSYKVGRKGCDVIIATDKGVSRVHAEILVDAMTNSPGSPCQVRIRDCSKYGTIVTKDHGSVEKVHQFPNKETSLIDGSTIQFGTGNNKYKFSVIPFVFWVCSETYQANHPLQDKFSSIGAQVTYSFSQECTHIFVDEFTPIGEDLLKAIEAKIPCIRNSWVTSVAEEKIRTEIPSFDLHIPTITVDAVSVKLAEPRTRDGCLEGYTFVLDSINNYRFRNRLKSLLDITGAKVLSVEEFTSSSQRSDTETSERAICVIPGGPTSKLGCFNKLSSLSRINETDLLCAALTANLDRSLLISPCVVVSSSCSTDETIVADSEEEEGEENATSFVRVSAHAEAEDRKDSTDDRDHDEEIVVLSSSVEVTVKTKDDKIERPNEGLKSFRPSGSGGFPAKRERVGEGESGNVDVIYSQCLIVRDLNPSIVACTANINGLNFKRFRKKNIQSGNSFENLIPFSQFPYKESGNENEIVTESLKEEKRRKQRETISEDLFNNDKGRRSRGVSGGVHKLLSTKGRT